MTEAEKQAQKIINRCLDIVYEEVERTLMYLGEKCVSKVKDRDAKSSWIDQTSNLRSSIGYAIYKEGHELIRSQLSGIGADGVEKGNKMLTELAKQYADSYSMVVIAGMDYASLVEARENKDVLASTELWARGVCEEYLKKAFEKAEARINSL